LDLFVIYQWNIRQFVYQWAPKVGNVSPKSFHPPLVGVLADLPLLTDGNEKTSNISAEFLFFPCSWTKRNIFPLSEVGNTKQPAAMRRVRSLHVVKYCNFY
jgi:hypothetical protein